MFENLNEQNMPKRRRSKYRSIEEFLSTYQSAYRQENMRPKETQKRPPRDFI